MRIFEAGLSGAARAAATREGGWMRYAREKAATRLARMLVTGIACASGATGAIAQPTGNPNAYVEGILHNELGMSTLVVGSDGSTVFVQNIGANGGDGVLLRTASGKGVGARLNFGPLLSTAGASAVVKFLGSNGQAQCVRTITSMGNGVDRSMFDLSGMGAASVTIDEYGESGNLVSTQTFSGPVGIKMWTPRGVCADGSATLESVRWTKECSTCDPVLEIERVCPADGAGWLSGTPRARIVVRGHPPTQGQFGNVIDSMSVTASGIPSFAVAERHLETFGAKVKGTGNVHLTESCPEGAVCADQSRARLRAGNIGASGADGVSIATAPARLFRMRSRPEILYQAWDETIQEALIELESNPPSVSCITSAAADGMLTIAVDPSELGSDSIVLTTSLNGVPTGSVSGNSASIRLRVAAADWFELDPIFTVEVGARLRSGVIAEVGAGRPATVGRRMIIQNGSTQTEVLADSMMCEILGTGGFSAITGGAAAGRFASGGAMEISDVSWELVCPADLNGDGIVEDTDFVLFAGAYDILLCDDAAMASGCPADLNDDAMVDDLDFIVFAKAYDELVCP